MEITAVTACLVVASFEQQCMPCCRAPVEKEFDACKASAAGMLAFRPHTRSELTTKLTDKGYDKACIERSIHRLQELVSPCLISVPAAGYAPSYWTQSSHSSRHLHPQPTYAVQEKILWPSIGTRLDSLP